MSLKEIMWSMLQGSLDSLKGVYWLFNLDAVQRRAHEEREMFVDMRNQMKSDNTSPTKTLPPRFPSNKEEPRLLNRVAQCCTLNGLVFGTSILIFNHVVLPFLQMLLSLIVGGGDEAHEPNWFWVNFVLQCTFDSLWVLPLFILSRIVNALWFQDIGNLAYRYSVGRPKGNQSLSTFIADNLFSFIIQFLFLLQAMMVSYIPLSGVGSGLFMLHMSLLYSLYSFEYKWVQMGWPLHQRLSFLETNWPYFLGFGLPLTLLTWLPGDYFISACVFAIVFPIFIISGNEAQPVVNLQTRRLQLFCLVVASSNAAFNRSMRSRRAPPSSQPRNAQPPPKRQLNRVLSSNRK